MVTIPPCTHYVCTPHMPHSYITTRWSIYSDANVSRSGDAIEVIYGPTPYRSRGADVTCCPTEVSYTVNYPIWYSKLTAGIPTVTMTSGFVGTFWAI